jgi:epoxyqueuosine reductase
MEGFLEQIKTFVENQDIPVLGMGPASRLEMNSPIGYRPSDLLSSAKSMVCLGLPVPKGVFKIQNREHQTYWRAANIYYRHIDALLLKFCNLIEATGETAVPVFGWFPYDLRGRGDFWGYVSLVKMAEAVGLGTIGKNGLLVHTRFGPRLILGGLVTTADLPEETFPERDNCACPEDCYVCQENCPVGAIDKTGKVDRQACLKHSMKSPLFSFLMKSKLFNPEEVEMLNQVTGVDDHSAYICLQCVSTCPLWAGGQGANEKR